MRKNKVEGITHPDFKLHYKAIIIKTDTPAEKHTHRVMEQNRAQKPTLYGQLTHDKGGKNIQWNNDSLSTRGAGKTGKIPVEK